jgi:tetratricopeptide (TPR) repeat protein
MRASTRSLLAAFGLLLSALPLHAAEDVRKTITVKDADYFGFDLRTVQNVSLGECEAACIDDNACKAFTYNTKAKWCFLKSDFNKINPFPGAVAGKIVVEASEPDIGEAPVPDFLTEQQWSDAERYRDNLELAQENEGMGVDALLAIARRDVTGGVIDHALQTYKGALSIEPDNAAIWLEMANAANRITNNWDINGQGLSAAINAYSSSRTTGIRAEALSVLARALENTQNYRAGINSYKASLKLVDSRQVRKAYEDLKARQGFRVVGNTIDSDSADPRACVQFSEPLVKSGVDYASFVTLDGTTPKALEAKGSEICVEALKIGRAHV